MLFLNLLNEPIVLVDLFMINITPNIFYFCFIFSAYSTLLFKLDYFFSGAVFLAISPLVSCGNAGFSLQCLFSFLYFMLLYRIKSLFDKVVGL